MLEQKRFITSQWVDFQKNQLDVLRARVAPSQFITTNLGGLGWANKFDRYEINRDLDFASWDNYVGTGHLQRSEEHTSELQSLMRISYAVFCLKKKNTTPITNTQR